ncbi:hypothetical protein CGMCC3_g17518 [Colletotrichum fructicola]|uniref:Uncharacterized protein n=2 Tax=Colletotrichum fructicola (strain Nara gc5) TaxID=1213859 RepID=A0A7J6IH07_COLFN|nr:uncharacterized protein CGMCC3_g17518 [Colletotrichum fructicola]KAE9566300.1 hypothetical protein CGMCC3_g17518 [Colletotrichum fructicola]KAF4475271.1 hypothetical protein CGGC5_v016075 [Colletotrichum fructicola Nara gc5]
MNVEYIFEFQSTIIVAHGAPVFIPPDLIFHHVLRLELGENDCPNLPRKVVLKKEGPERKDLFDREISIYDQLRPLQGNAIPQYLGLASIEGVRALLLSDIGGVAMSQMESPLFDGAKLEEMIATPLNLIRQHGVTLGYLSMCNIHWCDDAFRVVDLAHAQIVSEESESDPVKEQVRDLVGCFQARHKELLRDKEMSRRPVRPARRAARSTRHGARSAARSARIREIAKY